MNASNYDLIFLSHLRWDSVFQRPHRIMSRFSKERRVFFFEEPLFDGSEPRLEITRPEDAIVVATPHLPEVMAGTGSFDLPPASWAVLRRLFDSFLESQDIKQFVLWYYTPMALEFSRHLSPLATIYDCMDELSAFAGASPRLPCLERELFSRADVVFTGGQSLFEAKQSSHPAVYCIPSSVDVPHFSRAREIVDDPPDQAPIPHPRIGFFGIIDERLDVDLLRDVATIRPDWQFVLLGPVYSLKLDADLLPRGTNIHYLGPKPYAELPQYLAGWDVAILPFACNDSTRFISPTKTPEYLAAGKPVVSTAIRDVVRTYGQNDLVRIGNDAVQFAFEIENAMHDDPSIHLQRVDAFLGDMSWDSTWKRMRDLVTQAAESAPLDLTSSPARDSASV